MRAASEATPNARGDAVPGAFIAPGILPSLPSRFYFRCGAPIDAAAAVAGDAGVMAAGSVRERKEAEREAALKVYQVVKKEVSQRGCVC